MIKIENVSFSYSKKNENILKDINITIHDGECVLLCGESGCGKTTITKLINGLIPHFYEEGVLSGKVMIDDLSIPDTEIYKISEIVGSVFQNPKSQFFHLDSDTELSFGLENRGVEPEKMRQQLQTTIKELNIESLLHRDIFSMSGGEKQSLAFAGVCASNPKILVLDEPTANLDEESILRLREQIKLEKLKKKTIVISEHRLWFLKDLIDRAIFIRKGRIEKIYSREEFYRLSDEERKNMGLRGIKKTVTHKKDNADIGDYHVMELTTGYKKQIIGENISFQASAGKVLVITGRNGEGKTTLLRSLCGLQKIKGGEIELYGERLNTRKKQKRSFLVMQDVNHQLFSDSVWNECLLCNKRISDKQITEVLSQFDLLGFKESHPMALSGGQKQRLAIVTAILSDKKVILFDEPTSGLDYLHMMSVSKVINDLSKNGKIVVVVTHDMELVEELNAVVYQLKRKG